MTGPAVVLVITSGIVAVVLFVRCYRYAYPVARHATTVSSRADAVTAARLAVHRLTGLDSGGWSVRGSLHVDDDIVERLHHLDQLEPATPGLERSGLTSSWRVRFIGTDRRTVLVGLACSGAVVLLDVSAQARKLIPDTMLAAPPEEVVELESRLDGDGSRMWHQLRGTGSGTVDRGRLGVERSYFFSDVFDPISVEYQVDTVGRAVVRVDQTVSVAENRSTERAMGREAIVNAWALVGSVAAVITGVVLLATVGTIGSPWPAVALATVAGLAAIGNELAGSERAAVNTFDGTTTTTTFRLVNLSVSAVGVALTAAVVLVAGLAGSVVAERLDVPIWTGLGAQMLWGIWFAALWLGAAAAVFAVLRRRRLVRIAETPDRRTLRIGGLHGPQILGIVVQSAVSEEIVFRLLGMAVVTWLTGNVVVAAVCTAVLWATMHTGSAVTPRFTRIIELTVVGIGLGLLTVEIGLLAALVAHALFNAVTLLVPVVARRETTDDNRLTRPVPGRAAA